jgi:hypothetical protein
MVILLLLPHQVLLSDTRTASRKFPVGEPKVQPKLPVFILLHGMNQVKLNRGGPKPPRFFTVWAYSERRKFNRSCFCEELSVLYRRITWFASDPELLWD